MKAPVYSLIPAFFFFCNFNANSQLATSLVNLDSVVMQNPKLLLGITYDCRSSLSDQSNMLMGYHNTDGTFNPAVDAVFSDFPMSTLRYPANGIMQGFEWKKSIGPLAGRTAQQVFSQPSIPAQVMEFGFDEFMSMTLARGVQPQDVQIMVPIYDAADAALTPTQVTASIPNMVQSNADWVEYANSPNDGSNPGGGTDWAAIRAANGHPLPYGIEIWNMGNEPYTANEYTSAGVGSYINNIVPIMDAMLAIDPTIKITVTTTGKVVPPSFGSPNGNWTYIVLNSPLLQGKMYGVNCHYFMTEEFINGVASNSVSVIEPSMLALANAALAQGYKLIVGDQAHAIISVATPTQAEQDIAMQWQGANLSADMLLTMSQVENIERSNFWVYGLWTNQWHPIRKNMDGTFTSMPVAELYKKLNPLFLDNSLQVTNSSPLASDGNPYSVRSGAFASSDLTQINLISVNRDKTNVIPLQVTGLAAYDLTQAKILTASALNSDIILENQIAADANGNFNLPAMSILILEYTEAINSLTEKIKKEGNFSIYPNPANRDLNFSAYLDEFSITNSLGQEIIQGKGQSVSIQELPNGIYFLKSANGTQKFCVNRD